MKTIGEIIKDTRLKKNLSLAKVEAETKIKKNFLSAIEKEDWDRLPEFPVVLGFIKNIAIFLKTDPDKAAALLRRDYPPRPLTLNPKPDVSKEFVWSPKLTFFTGVGIILVGILAYLIFQYVRFVSPPSLKVYSPKEGEIIVTNSVKVEGISDSVAKVIINGQAAILDKDGNFSEMIEISKETQEIVISAKSRSGKETTLVRKIIPKFE